MLWLVTNIKGMLTHVCTRAHTFICFRCSILHALWIDQYPILNSRLFLVASEVVTAFKLYLCGIRFELWGFQTSQVYVKKEMVSSHNIISI